MPADLGVMEITSLRAVRRVGGAMLHISFVI